MEVDRAREHAPHLRAVDLEHAVPIPIGHGLTEIIVPELAGERLLPLLEAPGEFDIAAALDLLIPFLRRPSYCLSFLTLDP